MGRSALSLLERRVLDLFMVATAVLDERGGIPMCFAEPGRVGFVDGSTVLVTTSVGTVEASLRLVEAEGRSVVVGDWVLVSLGLVVSVVDEATGRVLFDEMVAVRQELGR